MLSHAEAQECAETKAPTIFGGGLVAFVVHSEGSPLALASSEIWILRTPFSVSVQLSVLSGKHPSGW